MKKRFFSFPFFSPATNLYGYITTESVPPFAVGFLGGLNKKYQCLTVLLRLPLPTGILECSQAHIGNPFIPEYQFSTTHLQSKYLEPSKQLQTMKNTWRQTFVYQLLLDFNTSNLLFGGSQKSAYLCNAFLPRRILRAFILPSRGQS